jgi:cell division protein FtsL
MNALRDRPSTPRRPRTAAGGSRAPATKRRHLRVVRPPAPQRRRRLAFLVAAFALTSSLIVGVVSLQALVSQTAFRMERVQTENQQLQLHFDELRLQLATLSSPQRIEREARRIGLVYPDPANVKTISVKGGAAGERTLDDQPSFGVKQIIGSSP